MADRGRPAFKPTLAHRRKVEECVSCGMSEREVAVVIGISEPTLHKYFEEELTNGRAKKRAEVVSMLYATARKGNVTAQKKLEEMTGASAAAAAWEGAEGIAAAPSARKLGKKEEAQIAAQTAGEGSEWGDDLRPGRSLPH